ncbi:hypothetical protein M0R45_002160 [Rubus argutus]|uniref:CCHC-type domain-containing protein n=1 Tax=Rubus argutus TaxID=59490 RepID=A0AAW1VCP7_RUBAR
MTKLLAEASDDIKTFLACLPQRHWSCAYTQGNRYGEMYNNVAESFNSWIIDFLSLPIHKMIDDIQIKMMEMIGRRRVEAFTWPTILCPTIEKRLKSNMDAVIQRDGRDVYDFVEVSFWTSMILDSYSFFIFPVSDVDRIIEKDIAGDFLVLPPKTKIPPGRPKTKRIKSIGEKPKMIKCGRCGKMGRHNRKTCNAPN